MSSHFLSYQHAFIVGAFIVLFPLRMTILPGKMPSETGMVASATVLLGRMAGLSALRTFLLGWLVGPVLYGLLVLGFLFNSQQDNTQYQSTTTH